MALSPIMGLHIASGTLGLLSGSAAIAMPKGSRPHRQIGNVFVLAMMSLTITGVSMAIARQEPGNIFGGVLTFYLVTTAWLTARRGDGPTGVLDWSAAALIFLVVAATAISGVEAAISPTGRKFGFPAGVYFFLGSIATLALIGDLRMLAHGGVSGRKRIVRHLWRMCFGLFIASASVFLARQKLFPAFMRSSGALIFLSVLPLILMVFWVIRVRLANAYKARLAPL